MKIVAPTEQGKPFVFTSTGLAFFNMGEILGGQTELIESRAWRDHMKRGPHEDVDIVLFEAAYMEQNRLSTRELRTAYPNAKLVCLGSDTIYFTTTGKNGGWQFDSPLDVDLFLETMHDPEEAYRGKGVNVGHWDWTGSETFFMRCTTWKGVEREYRKRFYDFICVLSPHTVNREGSYRKRMFDHLEESTQYSITRGGGSGMDDSGKGLSKTLDHYCQSRVCIGTSSHDNPQFFGRKGWRDAIAPFLGCVLCYDDFPDVMADYQVGGLMPLYKYGKFDELFAISDYLRKNESHRNWYLETQRQFFWDNSIEAQLLERFNEHGIISHDRFQTVKAARDGGARLWFLKPGQNE